MDHMKREGERVREVVWPPAKDVPTEGTPESNETE
jgi:hypothetical protein